MGLLILGISAGMAVLAYRLIVLAELNEVSALPAAQKSNPIKIATRGSTILVGSHLRGLVILNNRAPVNTVVSLSSSNLAAVDLASQTVVIEKGQESTSFLYRGAGAGSSDLSARTDSFGSGSAHITATVASTPSTLRAAGSARDLLMGAAVSAGEFGYPSPLKAEPSYAATLGQQYSMLEPENAMKWSVLHPTASQYDFRPGDDLVAFAQAHNMKVRGHTLVWCHANPLWLDAYKQSSPAVVAQLLHEHIRSVMSHYKGKVFAWDVVNEALQDNNSADDIRLKHCLWYDQPGIGKAGTGAIEQAFRWAHEADPEALLFYNEYDVLTPNGKFEAMYNMLADFVRRRVPINGVGLQMHLGTNGYPESSALERNIERLTELGLQVHITEVDVAVPVDSEGRANAQDLKAQAETYHRILKICMENPKCTAFQTWGFSDKHSWVPKDKPGYGAALPFDLEYKSKPAFSEMLDVLNGTEKASER